MGESDANVLPEQTPPASSTVSGEEQGANRKPVLIAGGGLGCIVLLCVGLLVGANLIFWGNEVSTLADDQPGTGEPSVSTEEPAPPPTEANVSPDGETNNATAQPVDKITLEGEAAANPPEISRFSFARKTTPDGEPVEPDFVFESGLTELHVVFEYAGMLPDYSWTQIWYHNGAERLRTTRPWLENETGVYDHMLKSGSKPFAAGEWALELYVEDELLSAGSFTIESQEEISATGDLPTLADIPKLYKIAYPKWNGEKHDLYVGDTNGDREQFIMRRAAGPSWSRDGRYIFFYGEEGVDQQVINGVIHPLPGVTNGIARLNAAPLPASVAQIQLLQGHGWNDGTARWANVSPDGTMIAYDGDRGGGRRIYFLGTNANQQFRYEIIGEQADWSPDSQQIVYRSGRNNQTGIWISNRTDSGHTRITGGGSDSFPTWSPDGKTIAFSRDAGGNVDIYTVNVDGTNLTRLTDAPGHDTLPAYLPNGDLIFRSARGGYWAIWKMKEDGTDQTEIIANAPVGPDWAFSKMGVLR
jgi:hypothetical protein